MKNKYEHILTINKDTGEVINTQLITSSDIVIGNRLITEKTTNRNKGFVQKLENTSKTNELKNHLSENVGEFFHLLYEYGNVFMPLLYNDCEGNNTNIHIIRFIKLATCLNKKNNLENKHKHRVKKTDLKNIWNISNRNHINETYNILKKHGYINVDDDGYISINDNVIYKGKITEKIKELKKMNENITYIRVFEESIKGLYEGAKATERKQLANLFKILPFVNYRYNVICSNPSETDEEKIIPLVWSEIAEICGYDISQTARFRNSLTKFEINNKSVIGTFTDNRGEFISVNPNIYYGGNSVPDVEFLAKLFNFSDKLGAKTKRRGRTKKVAN